MEIVADRFLVDEDAAIGLATGENVRVTVASPLGKSDATARVDLCDRLATLPHPLLIPLVDGGYWGSHWFEAHACVLPLHATSRDIRGAALHLVRFLRAANATLTADNH